jgi:hypothetical protein
MKPTKSKKHDKLFMTGCDQSQVWMLPWFIENYRKHNDTPICFCDFGVDQATIAWMQHTKCFDLFLQIKDTKVGGWFLKPYALYHSPSPTTVWIDTDCEVLGDISGVFDYIEPGKIAMAIDRPWTKRSGEEWHNSGVTGVKGKPEILRKWMTEVQNNPKRGDQETLHAMLPTPLDKMINFTEIPNKYNWLRVQLENDNEDSKDKLVMHWTGKKGKDRIKDKIAGKL